MCVPGLLSGLDWVECGCCVVLIGGSSVSSLVSGCDAVTGRTRLKGQTLYCVHSVHTRFRPRAGKCRCLM